MKAGSPHPIGLVVALLLAACDGSSHPSVTAPPLPPRPAPPNDSLTHTGTVTILGLASSDPADTCIAGSVRRSVGREWPISIALRLDASRPYGEMTTPLVPVAECAFDFSAASRYEFTACGFTSSDWTLGETCTEPRRLEVTALVLAPDLYCDPGDFCLPAIPGSHKLVLDVGSRLLEVLVQIDLR
ncbi:MAG: hypothetical protein KBF21_17735 [Thermoanaerobaculia bacterium]|nr:hypothetical protein [Thermoanaerobaculia bacterium]